MINRQKQQSGFIILMGMLLLVIGASTWFAIYGGFKSTSMKLAQDELNIKQLELIKERMLTYAVLHPELYDGTLTPGVGYFPCPDENGNGEAESACGQDSSLNNQLFVYGRVPNQITGIRFNFFDGRYDSTTGVGKSSNLFWYALDSRFVNSSQEFDRGGGANRTVRFAELNSELPNRVTDSTSANVPPLTLDGRDDIVMVLFYAGEPLAGDTRAADDGIAAISNYLEQGTISSSGNSYNFVSSGANPDTFNDYVIAITRNEWEKAVLSRLTLDLDSDNNLDICPAGALPAWIQPCTYNDTGSNQPPFSCNADTVDNFTGQGWSNILANCP